MRLARFVIAACLLPGAIPPQATAQLARIGQQAVASGDYTTAVYFLKPAVAAEPKHATAWKDLCRAYLALDQVDAAIDACLKQIDVNPQSPGVYGELGRALWRKGKRDEAISAFQQQVEVAPRDIAAHGTLGHYFCELGRYADAVPELETFVAADPNSSRGQEDLGGAYLAVGQTDKGLAILSKLAEEHAVSATLNNVAYRLASHRVRLDLAQQYAETAVTNTAAMIAGAEASPSLGALRLVVLLTVHWDTLGWVHFQQGDLDKAARFITAAWSANPSGPIGDHLGQLYERRGQKQQAIRVYARALAARDAIPETRHRLEALLASGEALRKLIRSRKPFPPASC
jgi:tetratricopeptide (TPR) repeat protein